MHHHLHRLFRAAPQGNVTIDSRKPRTAPGFTIVELLVVIVVIGILAAITIVTYTGISQKAIASSLQSDLTNTATKLKAYYTLYGSYPTALDGSSCPTAPTVDANYCLKVSSSSTLTYSSIVPTTFHLTDTNGNNSYSITDATAPAIATTTNGSAVGSPCPSGFIPVPGSGTYGTNDFCVMKYEAKNAGSNVPVSQAAGSPWVSINQTDSATYSSNVVGCTGCHLITEGEWMTLAQNVLSVASNWDNGAGGHTVGTGYIYSGHNDNVPANALAAAADNDPYNGTGQSSPSNQKRTLTLSNGQVIWDLAGNVFEWTSGTSTTGQPGVAGNAYAAWIEWPNVTTPGTLSPNVFPSGTGISNANTWTSTNGIGQLISNPAETGLLGFVRGGAWAYGGYAGVLSLNLNSGPGNTGTPLGFRVSR